MTLLSNPHRSTRQAARIFLLLFIAMIVGFHLTIGGDALGLGGLWSSVAILAVLLLIVALVFVK